MMRSLLTTLLLAGTVATAAQERTRDGALLRWDHSIHVDSATLSTPAGPLPAHAITVFESNTRNAQRLWSADMAASTQARMRGSRPMVATGVQLPGIPGPVEVRAQFDQDRRSGHTTITLAIIRGDSTVADAADAARSFFHAQSVRLNRAVVQQQMDDLRKRMGRTEGRLDKAVKDEHRMERRLVKANRDLERAMKRKMRAQRSSARGKGDIAGLERRYHQSNNTRDLKRLTQARNAVARDERRMARLMRDEARAQGRINDLQRNLPNTRQSQREHGDIRDLKQQQLETLQRKMDAIQ